MFGWLIRWFWWSGGAANVEETVLPGGAFRRSRASWVRVLARAASTWRRAAGRPATTWLRVWRYDPMATSLDVDTLVGVVGEVRDYAFDFSKAPELKTGSGLTISSVEIIHSTSLTIGTPAVLAAAFDGIPAGKGASVRISGFADDTVYHLACRATLSNGAKLVVPGRLVGVADVEVTP